jgi:hypothetical protein
VRLTTMDVQPLGGDAARELGTFAARPKANRHNCLRVSMSSSGRSS